MSLKQEEIPEPHYFQEEEGEVKSIGSWTFQENLLYVVFLQKNKVIMLSKRKRRDQRVFDRMSEFITTRTSLQCRSHHQKFLQKLGDVKAIINNFKKYITKDDFRLQYQRAVGKHQRLLKKPLKKNPKLQEASSENQLGKFKNQSLSNEVKLPSTPKNQVKNQERRNVAPPETEKFQPEAERAEEHVENGEIRLQEERVRVSNQMTSSQMFPLQFPFMGFPSGLANYPFLTPCFQPLRPFY